ncbi:4-coumarate--CoA ligase 1 [Drosophila grimshawi]|uniref:GH15631 n=1 Tax=Drosophila grimshawi TaxID=7222 RepID=B4JT21_DROGR|nr:4-coumarate--CoA ligase 1 [Drosophila grimshawi]EDV94911.1 GH15631 [Drosophila grimshawi]
MPYNTESNYNAEDKIWCGPQSSNYFAPDLSIGEIIFHEMRRHPKLIAQISDTENTVLTREELHLNSMHVASYMRSLGLVQTDIVGIIGRNTTHIFAVVYGCFFNGIAFHSLNTSYEQSTIEKLFDITKPRLIFCDGEDYEKVKSATEKLNAKIITMRNHQSGSISIEEVLATPVETDFQPARLEQGNDQTLAILCSSGTTGIPKAVTISNSRKMLNSSNKLTTADVQFSLSTLDWATGLVTTVSSGVYSTKRIISDKPFDAVRYLRIIEEYKVTWVIVVPSHMAMLVNCPEFEKANLHSIRHFMYGGGSCSLAVQQSIRDRLRDDCLHQVYAFTEAGSAVIKNLSFDQKPNSVGSLLNGIKMKVLTEQGKPLGPNEVGEICVYNGEYWAGYFGNPEESSNVRDSELWFYTGDLGYMDDDGFLYIMDRKKDMLKYQNIMYYPHEIEEVISQMPGVAEVCVFGIWNPLVGDKAAAAVVKKIGSKIQAQDVVDFVKGHCSAIYKHLHGGAIIVDDLIRSPNGKTNRAATKAYFVKINDEN